VPIQQHVVDAEADDKSDDGEDDAREETAEHRSRLVLAEPRRAIGLADLFLRKRSSAGPAFDRSLTLSPEGARVTLQDSRKRQESARDRARSSLPPLIPIHVNSPGHGFTAAAVIEPTPAAFHCPRKTFRFAISPRLTAARLNFRSAV